MTEGKAIPLATVLTNFTRAEAEQIIDEANADNHLKWGGRKEVLEKYHISKWDLTLLARSYGLQLKRMRKRFASDPDSEFVKLKPAKDTTALKAQSEKQDDKKPLKRKRKIWRRHGKYSAEGYKRLVLAARRNARKRRAMVHAKGFYPGTAIKPVAVAIKGKVSHQVVGLEARISSLEEFKKDILAVVNKYGK